VILGGRRPDPARPCLVRIARDLCRGRDRAEAAVPRLFHSLSSETVFLHKSRRPEGCRGFHCAELRVASSGQAPGFCWTPGHGPLSLFLTFVVYSLFLFFVVVCFFPAIRGHGVFLFPSQARAILLAPGPLRTPLRVLGTCSVLIPPFPFFSLPPFSGVR